MNLDHETLKDLSMHSVGQRMDFLRHVYNLKALWRIPLNEWDYVPPSKCAYHLNMQKHVIKFTN